MEKCHWVKHGPVDYETYNTDCGMETSCYPYTQQGTISCPYCHKIVEVTKLLITSQEASHAN
jgi:hypothetical protein